MDRAFSRSFIYQLEGRMQAPIKDIDHKLISITERTL